MKLLKQTLRNRLREKRLQLPEGLQHHFSTQIARRLIQSASFQSARSIAFYAAAFGEVSTDLIFRYALAHHKACYFPVLHENRLLFVQVSASTSFHLNRFNILEPAYDTKKTILPTMLDLVVLPLVAFDRNGYRLGMGGGFYDRTFAFKRHHAKKPKLVGFAYDFQCVTHVPRSHLDVLLDEVITEKKKYVVKVHDF